MGMLKTMKIMLTAMMAVAVAVPALAQEPPAQADIRAHERRTHEARAGELREQVRTRQARAAEIRVRTLAEARSRAEAVQRGRSQSAQTERIARTFHLGAAGELDLANVSGDIVVRRAPGQETTVEVVKTARGASDEDAKAILEAVQVEISERGPRLEVRARFPERDEMRRLGRRAMNVDVAVTVAAPAATRVRAQSVAGSVTIENITGEVSAESVSGEVRILNGGRVSAAKSISGSVEITGAATERALHASTVSGNLTLRKVKADQIDAGTISGEILLEDVTSARVKAQTVSGDVRFSGPLAANARFQLGSHSGNVHLALRPAGGFEVEASSFSGSVQSDFPLTVQPGVQQAARHRQNALRGVHGDGSALLNLTTFSGNITIQKR